MGPKHIPRPNRLLEMRAVGTVMASAVFGITIILAIACLRALCRARAQGRENGRRFYYLAAYVVFMLAISTFAVIESTLSLLSLTFHEFYFIQLKSGSPIALPIAVWGADGFMLWRCLVLYSDVSRRARRAVICFVVFLGVKMLALGVLAYLKITGFMGSIILIAFTTAINLIILFLIVFRLIRQETYLRKLMNTEDTRSPYTIIINMCLESSAMIVLVGVGSIVAAIGNPRDADAILVLVLLMPHICVISPLLIVYRVAEGTAATNNRRKTVILEPLKFATISSDDSV